jgi:hypothetical protein
MRRVWWPLRGVPFSKHGPDRGFGRPQQTTLVGAADEQRSESPYADLSDEEQLEDCQQAATG